MKTVLTVDDSPSVRQMVKAALTGAGYGVVEAGDGAQGLDAAKANAVALIVTDLNMPNMNGLEFIRAVRQIASYRGVPIVFLTSESDDYLRKDAKAAGATAWIAKPFKQNQLLGVVRKLIG